jgi:hypothetical protein
MAIDADAANGKLKQPNDPGDHQVTLDGAGEGDAASPKRSPNMVVRSPKRDGDRAFGWRW